MPRLQLLLLVATFAWLAKPQVLADDVSPAAMYANLCASCHGAQGEGVEGMFENPLHGDASIEALAERIDTTMPADDPELCTGDEARQVAEYIYNEFYSEAARQANGMLGQPRVDLTRLTVPQFRSAVADLLAEFTPPVRSRDDASADQRGLQAAYYQSDGMNKTDKRKLERIDPQIDFDFGERGPSDDIAADQFAVIWQGSLQVPETGVYEFRIRSENGVRLYLNAGPATRYGKLRDDSSSKVQTRLIDGWVSSGEKRTLTGKVFLLGGHRYPLQVDFFKFKDPTASIRVEWRPPHGVWSVLDSSVLQPSTAPRTFVVDTPFPADDRSMGYERGSSISAQWHSAVTEAALATAEEVVERLPELSGVGPDVDDRRKRLGAFLVRFAEVAFRRPLSDEEQTRIREMLMADDSPEAAVRRGVLLVIASPHFLYTDLTPSDQRPSQHTVAARLALALWDSLPDAELRKAAAEGQLGSAEQVAAQAERMVSDPRTKNKLREFFTHWLELHDRDLAKDTAMFPDFDAAVIADLRHSLDAFVDQVVWSESSDYRQLLLADYLLLNRRLLPLYAPASAAEHVEVSDHEFVAVDCEEDGRSGILTHPYLLSAFSYHNNTSPIHRGVFLTRNIVGRQLKPPPVAVSFDDSEFAPELTMREKVTQLTRDQACRSCHDVINPLGFALESYDAVGRWRTSEQDQPIDTRSTYVSAAGTSHDLAGARDIAEFAIDSPAAQRAFVTQIVQHIAKQNPAAYGPDVAESLRQQFADDEFHILRLVERIATQVAMHQSSSPAE